MVQEKYWQGIEELPKCSLGHLPERRVLKTGLGYCTTLLVVILVFHGEGVGQVLCHDNDYGNFMLMLIMM
jgi:hypothetical protein